MRREPVLMRSLNQVSKINLTNWNKTRTITQRDATRGERNMLRAVLEEALALASITLFLATIAVWAQVLGVVV